MFLADPPKSRLRRLVGVLRLEPGALVLIFVGTVLSSLVSLAQPLLAGSIVGVLQGEGFLAALPYGLVLAGLAVFASGITAVVNVVGAKAGNRTVRVFRDESAAIALRVPADKLVQHPTADLVARCSIDSEHLSKVFSQGPVQALGGVVMVVGALFQMAVLDPVLTVSAVGLTVVCLVFIIVISNRLTSFSFRRQEAQGAYVAEVTRALDSVLTLRAFVADRFAVRRLDKSSGELLEASNRGARAHAFMSPVVTICVQATLLVIVCIAVVRVQAGVLSVEQLVSFFMYMMLIITPITGSAGTVMDMAECLGALQRIIDLRAVTDQPASRIQIKQPVAAQVGGVPVRAGLVGEVGFRDVSVRYPQAGGNREYALAGVTFSVPAGSWVAMTGSSGSGKSTVLSLLEKFIVPTEGAIMVDRVPLGEHDDDEYRRQVGYIEQACPLFSGTVRDNLLLGRDIDDDRCWEIIHQVGLADTISAREGGLDTPVGESAYAFSGGERQRLAIARTLVGQPRMLLLDEITSGLDVLNREQIMNLIRTTMGGITTFAAGHGHFGMNIADLVLVLDKGRLVEFGPPAEVHRRSALFRSLVAA
jgi:transport protein